MNKQTVIFRSADGIDLCGVVEKSKKEPHSLAVLAHGITVEKHEGGFYSRLAKCLSKRGVKSLRFDFRGHGDSKGKPEEMTISGEIKDLDAAVRFLAGKTNSKVAIVGTSFGAGIAILYAARFPRNVSSLSLLCPVLDYQRTFLEPETEWAKEWFHPKALKDVARTGFLQLDQFRLGAPLIQEFRRLHPGETLLTLKVPTLIAHGTDDSMVPYSVAKHYGSKYKFGRFVSIPKADHGFEGFEKKVYSEVAQWITEHSAE